MAILNAVVKSAATVKACSECGITLNVGDRYRLSVAVQGTVIRRCSECAPKAERRLRARARAQAMRDLGMVRNRNGSWE